MLVACPHTALLDSRDFLAPMITVFEAELAFAPGAVWTPGQYRTGFGAGAAAAQEADERGDAAAAGGEAGASAAADEDVATSSTQLMVRGAAACMRSRCCVACLTVTRGPSSLAAARRSGGSRRRRAWRGCRCHERGAVPDAAAHVPGPGANRARGWRRGASSSRRTVGACRRVCRRRGGSLNQRAPPPFASVRCCTPCAASPTSLSSPAGGGATANGCACTHSHTVPSVLSRSR